MRLLTATAQGQGERDNDFHWCLEGELVILPMLVCSADENDPDGGCGCGRGFAGLMSHRATTTALVRDLPNVTSNEYLAVIRMSLEDQGYGGAGAVAVTDQMLRLASSLPLEVVVERRLDLIQVRRISAGR